MRQDHKNAAIIRQILSGARWAVILRLTAQIISWLSTIVVVRFISTSDYGLNAMLETPLEFLFLLCTFGLDIALVRAKNLEHDELRSTFGWLLVINGILFLTYFFGGKLISGYFNEPKLDLLAKVVAFVFLILPFRVIPDALLDRDLKFKLKATIELISSVIAAATTLILAVMGGGIWALVTGMLTNRIVLAILLMIVQPWFMIPSLRVAPARKMIAFGGIMTLASAVAVTGNMLPVLIAGPTLGSELLGIFVVAMQFSLLPLAKIMPVINPLIFPAFSKFQGQPVAIANYLEKSFGIAALVLLPIMVGIACVAEEFVLTILGEKWSLVVMPLTILSLFMPFRGATSFIRQVMGGIGRADIALKSTIVAWTLFFSMILIGSNYGIIGLVVAILITEPIVTLATVQMSKRVINTSITKIAHSLRPAITSSGLMAISVLSVKFLLGQGQGQGWIRLFVEIAVGVVIYLLVLRVFFRSHLESTIKLLRP